MFKVSLVIEYLTSAMIYEFYFPALFLKLKCHSEIQLALMFTSNFYIKFKNKETMWYLKIIFWKALKTFWQFALITNYRPSPKKWLLKLFLEGLQCFLISHCFFVYNVWFRISSIYFLRSNNFLIFLILSPVSFLFYSFTGYPTKN